MGAEPGRSGRSIQGASVGILMLETRFPRIPGDGGNARTWPFPVLYKVIRGASPERVVLGGATGLLDDFAAGARELVAVGADGITTNCGFLVRYQRELSEACQAPVAASALLQVPWVQSLLPPGRRVGVVTVSAASLERELLLAAGAPADTPVTGTDAGDAFSRTILGDEPVLDVTRARDDVLDAARRLVETHPRVGAIVLECTNMCPYAAELAHELRLPVYDFYSLVTWFHAGLSPARFD